MFLFFRVLVRYFAVLTQFTLKYYTKLIAQFRITGHTDASCIKPTEARLVPGVNESTRALQMVKHHCCVLNAQIAPRNRKKNVEKYPELANFPFRWDNTNNFCAAGMSEGERRIR